MNIIFLDVDGILTYDNYENEETADIDIEKVKLLKKICDQTHAKVVISSSWKGTENHIPHIYHILIDILTKNEITILGNTPHIQTEFQTNNTTSTIITFDNLLLNKRIKYGTGRAAEIQQWINKHNVTNFVILDDEDFQWSDYGYEKNWIQPTWFGDGGLQPKHVTQAIKILNNK